VFAAFGFQVAMFQWGWGEKIFGITKAETISFLPILMLAIIFGLSSDYEVFVVSRVKEEFTKTGDASAPSCAAPGSRRASSPPPR
jgi:RND superfamily putative drug exporter